MAGERHHAVELGSHLSGDAPSAGTQGEESDRTPPPRPPPAGNPAATDVRLVFESVATRLRCQDLPKIPGYELLEEIGRGGMGVVYRARQCSLDRDVALKIVADELRGDAEFERRFAQEAKLASQLQHPNIVNIYDFGLHEGRAWYAMEYVDGEPLSKYSVGRSSDPSSVVPWVATLARAVDFAHRRGVIHRDLKPANILVTRDGLVKILDFGLARSVNSGHEWTQPGTRMGSPGYSAPELWNGSGEASPVADIYSLGAILARLLTGCVPQLNSEGHSSRTDVAFVSPSTLPPRLSDIVRKATSHAPSDRYATAADFASALERYLRASRLRRRYLLLGLATLLPIGYFASQAFDDNEGPKTSSWSDTPELEIIVWNEILGDYTTLPASLPLSTGTRLKVVGRVPAKAGAVLLALNAERRLQVLLQMSPSSEAQRIQYPDPMQGSRVPLLGTAGTEVVFLVVRLGETPQTAEIESWAASEESWPALPKASLLRLSTEAVEVVQSPRDLGAAEFDPAGTVTASLERLRRAIKDRGNRWAGWAFAHQE